MKANFKNANKIEPPMGEAKAPAITPSPTSSPVIIPCLTITFSLLFAALTFDAIFVDKDLLREILPFVQYAIMGLLTIAGGKAVRDNIKRQ
jgi:hypothetical protein